MGVGTLLYACGCRDSQYELWFDLYPSFSLLLNLWWFWQGFQFIVNDSGGFSSVGADFLENIADEYTNTPVLLYAVKDPGSHMIPKSQKQVVSKNLHDAISFSRLSSFCKLIVPVGLPSLRRSKLYDICGMYCFSFRCLSTFLSISFLLFMCHFFTLFYLQFFIIITSLFLASKQHPLHPAGTHRPNLFSPILQTNLLFLFLWR